MLLGRRKQQRRGYLFKSIWKICVIKQHDCWLDLKAERRSCSLDKSKRAIDLPVLCCFMLRFHSFIVASANKGPLVAVILFSRVKSFSNEILGVFTDMKCDLSLHLVHILLYRGSHCYSCLLFSHTRELEQEA